MAPHASETAADALRDHWTEKSREHDTGVPEADPNDDGGKAGYVDIHRTATGPRVEWKENALMAGEGRAILAAGVVVTGTRADIFDDGVRVWVAYPRVDGVTPHYDADQ